MKSVLLAVSLVAAAAVTGDLPPQSAVRPVKIAEVPGYCEGIVFDRAGLGYVSDTQHGKIYTVTTDGKTAVWASTPAPNGHKVLADGTHLVCDKGAVLLLAADGRRSAMPRPSATASPCARPTISASTRRAGSTSRIPAART